MHDPVEHIQTVASDFAGGAGEQFHPHCGPPEPTGDDPHRGETDTGDGSPQGGELSDRLQRANETLSALAQAWARHALRKVDAKALAIEFRRSLTKHELVGISISSEWIETVYPVFCQSLGVLWPPPFKDFAKELKLLMPWKRKDVRFNGKRVTFTRYRVPDPNEAVVTLSEEMRKRA
jgi:hypothetical protein